MRSAKGNLTLLLLSLLFIGCNTSKENQTEKPEFSATLIILKDGILELTDGGGKTLRTVKSVESIHNFLWVDSMSILFTAKKGGDLIVYNYDVVQDSVIRIAGISNNANNVEFWDGGEFNELFTEGGKLFIECDFYQEMPLFYVAKQIAEVDLKTGKYRMMSRSMVQIDTYSKSPDYDSVFANRKPKGNFEVANDGELAYTNERGEKKVITNTPFPKESQDNGGGLTYQTLPDGKRIIFYAVTAVGDYLHGPVYAVNLDGNLQTKLADDIMGFQAFVTYPEGDVYFTNESNLYRLNENNSSQPIRKEITKVRCFGNHVSFRFQQ